MCIAQKRSSHESKKIVSNIGWLFSDLVVRILLSLFVGIWLARYLGPQQYGQLSFALALTTIFAGFVPLGLQSIVIRNINKDPHKTELILGTSFFLCVFTGVLSYLLLIGITDYVRPNEQLIKVLVSICGLTLLFKCTDVIKYWFESQVTSKYVVWVQNTSLILSATLKVILIVLQCDIVSFVWVSLVEALVSSILLLVIYLKKSEGISKWTFSFQEAKLLIRESWYLLFSSFAVIVNLNIDKIFLGKISGDHELGIYSVASNLSQVWYSIPLILGASLAPSLTKLFSDNKPLYEHRVNKVFQYLFWTATIVSIIVTFFSDFFIAFIFGNGYKESAEILIIQIYITIFLFHISFRKRLLIIEGKSFYILYLSLSMLITNILLNLYLIPLFNAKGAAYSSLISWILNALFFPLFFQSTRKHPMVFFLTIFTRK